MTAPTETRGLNRVMVWAAALTTTGEVALEVNQPGLRVLVWLTVEQARTLGAELGQRAGEAETMAAGEVPCVGEPSFPPDGGGL